MNVGVNTFISLVSFCLATAIGLTQLLKWIRESRDRRSLDQSDKTKSGAERDSITVKSAEGALLMMQGMLNLAQASEKALRADNDALRLRIHSLEASVGGLRLQMKTLEAIRRGSDGVQ